MSDLVVIGLAIVRRALQRIGGELRVESAVGQGNTLGSASPRPP